MNSWTGVIMGFAVIIGLTGAFVSARLSRDTIAPLPQQWVAQRVESDKEKEKPKPEMVDVVVAANNLVIGDMVKESDLALKSVAKQGLPPDTVGDIKQLQNKLLFRSIPKDGYVLARDVRREFDVTIPDKVFMYALIRKFTIPSDIVQPGERVDVIYTDASLRGKYKQSSKLRDLLVVDVAKPAGRGNVPARDVFSVELAVTEEQALLLKGYEKGGEVKLIPSDAKKNQP